MSHDHVTLNVVNTGSVPRDKITENHQKSIQASDSSCQAFIDDFILIHKGKGVFITFL